MSPCCWFDVAIASIPPFFIHNISLFLFRFGHVGCGTTAILSSLSTSCLSLEDMAVPYHHFVCMVWYGMVQSCAMACSTASSLHLSPSCHSCSQHDFLCSHNICSTVRPDRAGKDIHIFSKDPVVKARSIAPPTSVTLGGFDGHHNFCVIPPTLF